VPSNHQSYYDNMFSLIFNSEPNKAGPGGAGGSGGGNMTGSGSAGGFELFSLNKNQLHIQKPIGSGGGGGVNSTGVSLNMSRQQAAAAAANASNLSNFLNVRFEITQNHEQASKSKSKYKKSIKIASVSCRPLSALDANDSSAPDIQLKTYEFTEKCLSFRLASIDLNTEQPRRNFQIKLINLYEKFLCALVNFTSVQTGQESFKLYRIKHEETSSTTSATTSPSVPAISSHLNNNNNSNNNSNNSFSNSSLSSLSTTSSLPQMATTTTTTSSSENRCASSPQSPLLLKESGSAKSLLNADSASATTTTASGAESATFSGNCLAATSSSRLNLSEFILTSIPSASLSSRIVCIMPISVTSLEDENDLKYIAILSETGVISIIDPNKCCKLIDFPSVSNEDKFCSMIYCYG
jgi:hypothetical protein